MLLGAVHVGPRGAVDDHVVGSDGVADGRAIGHVEVRVRVPDGVRRAHHVLAEHPAGADHHEPHGARGCQLASIRCARRPSSGRLPETLLWTLYQRAIEAARPDGVLADPKAVELVDRIDYPFEQRFGRGDFGQWQALRVRCFDDEIGRFLAARPDGTVVALGEGLETQFWRVDNGSVRWLSVDLPEVAALRRRLLPEQARVRIVECSVLDPAWMDQVDSARGVLLTAQGLLMYLEPDDVQRLIALCARRFAGGALLFDAIPAWLAAGSQRRALKGPGGFEPPPWLWGLDSAERRRLGARRLPAPRGRGLLGRWLLPSLLPVMAIRF